MLVMVQHKPLLAQFTYGTNDGDRTDVFPQETLLSTTVHLSLISSKYCGLCILTIQLYYWGILLLDSSAIGIPMLDNSAIYVSLYQVVYQLGRSSARYLSILGIYLLMVQPWICNIPFAGRLSHFIFPL